MAWIALSILTAAARPAQGVEHWQLVSNKNGVAVWTRDVPNSSVQEVRADMVLDAAPEVVWNALTTVSSYPEFLTGVAYARVAKRVRQGERIEYRRNTNPQVSVYDEMLDVTSHGDVESSTYYMHWRCIPGTVSPGIPHIDVCEGAWALEPTQDGRTHLVYFNQADPEGKFPSAIFNAAQTHDLPEMMHQLAKHVASQHFAAVF